MAEEVTRLLQDWETGKKEAPDQLLPTTALVHEAYFKLAFRIFRQQIKNQPFYSLLIGLSPSDESFVDWGSRLIMRWRAVKPNI